MGVFSLVAGQAWLLIQLRSFCLRYKAFGPSISSEHIFMDLEALGSFPESRLAFEPTASGFSLFMSLVDADELGIGLIIDFVAMPKYEY